MNRRESARAVARPAPLVELERLARQLGAPDQGLLDAASETLLAGSEPTDLSVIPKFVEESAEICVAAHARFRELSAEQRVMLRGCSLDLIGLAADQCLRLERSFAEYKQSEADVKGAAANLASALTRAQALAEQARSVIQTVSGVAQQAVSAEVDDAVAAYTSAIQSLRDLARELLERGSPAVRKRCALYALDAGYVQMLETALAELSELSRRASDAALVARRKVQVERTLSCSRPLIEQIVQAFEHAARLDKNIVVLRAPADAKRGAVDPKRGTAVMQQKTQLMKPAAVSPTRPVEKLVLGGSGSGDRYRR